MRGAGFFCQVFATDVGDGILLEGDSGIAALLRAVVDESVFANIEVARASAAAPLVGPSLRDVVLEGIDAREAALLHAFHLVVNGAFFVLERLNLALAVVNDADGGTESEFHGAFTDRQRILRITGPTADD